MAQLFELLHYQVYAVSVLRDYFATSTVNYPTRIIEEFDGRRKRNGKFMLIRTSVEYSCFSFLIHSHKHLDVV